MKCISFLVLSAATLCGCGTGFVRIQTGAAAEPVAAPTPPQAGPPATVGADANVAVDTDAAATAPAAGAATNVDEAPDITTADPEEVTATSEPPDLVYEEQLDMPGPGYFWVGGYWGWTGTDWAWYGGRWLQPPEGRVYVDPYYERVGASVVFVQGYWGARDARPRSYGGERIRFAEAVRPADYRRGERARIAHRPGEAPGKRPAKFYEHSVGAARPLPHGTAPLSRTAASEPRPGQPTGGEARRDDRAAGERGKSAPPRESTAPRGAPPPRSAPASRPAAKPAKKKT